MGTVGVKGNAYLRSELRNTTTKLRCRFDAGTVRRYARAVKRLQLTRVRVCDRCGRGRADLATDDGTTLTIPLDPARAAELATRPKPGDLQPLSAIVLTGLTAAGAVPTDLVLDVAGQALRALLSVARGDKTDIVVCTPQEAVSLAVHAGIKLYATDDALARQRARSTPPHSETLH